MLGFPYRPKRGRFFHLILRTVPPSVCAARFPRPPERGRSRPPDEPSTLIFDGWANEIRPPFFSARYRPPPPGGRRVDFAGARIPVFTFRPPVLVPSPPSNLPNVINFRRPASFSTLFLFSSSFLRGPRSWLLPRCARNLNGRLVWGTITFPRKTAGGGQVKLPAS